MPRSRITAQNLQIHGKPHALQFVDPAVDDWRLEPDTPCPYHGAFEGDGGHEVPLPVQEYFVEAVLNAGETEKGLETNGTSRFTADPVFWFPPDQRGQSERDIRPLLSAV